MIRKLNLKTGREITGLNKLNIILGKNGCGKSRLLRTIRDSKTNLKEVEKIVYVTPERGGVFEFNSGVDDQFNKNPNYLNSLRTTNQTANYRQQTASLFNALELSVLRELESKALKSGLSKSDAKEHSFEKYLEKINSLLENIKVETDSKKTISIIDKLTEQKLTPASISSGEAEMISLAPEIIYFFEVEAGEGQSILLIDEPDSHLHPDLQHKFLIFLKELLKEHDNVQVILTTHSTCFLYKSHEDDNTSVSFMDKDTENIKFEQPSDTTNSILPVFGAHPLSKIFNELPVLLLEGEDDVRIWQQVVRSSQGRVKLYPCSVGSIDKLDQFELEAKKIIKALYDDGRGFSLRDADKNVGKDISDNLPIIRMRLNCRNSESLLLSKEVLDKCKKSKDEVVENLKQWLKESPGHQYCEPVRNFLVDCDFQKGDIKDFRYTILQILEVKKPWEVLIGQTISENLNDAKKLLAKDDSIFNFLGDKVVKNLLKF